MTSRKSKAIGLGPWRRGALRAAAVLTACVLAGLAPAVAHATGRAPAIRTSADGTAGAAIDYPQASGASNYPQISGAGSTWAENAITTWTGDMSTYQIHIDYNGNGSSTGRTWFKGGQVDFAASEIPYGLTDVGGKEQPPSRGYAYLPDVAGGTTFMYNLKVGNRRITNLRLSGATIAGIFTGTIRKWNDPAITRDNPQIALPGLTITPVVRSDGSGSTYQFTNWMWLTQQAAWAAYCALPGINRNPCGPTSGYPFTSGSGIVGQSGDGQVANYVSQPSALGSIGYVEYSYAINDHFPVAKVLNSAGYYTEPTAGNVAVSLLKAKINNDKTSDSYLTQDLRDVFTDSDPRTYELSSYSYFIVPTDVTAGMGFTSAKGKTLTTFARYALCAGQTQVDNIGYSALPINLVFAGYQQLQKVPGSVVTVPATDELLAAECKNPTFRQGHINYLADTDPMPQSCDKQGSTQCSTATGGAPGSPGPTGHGSSGNNGGANGTGANGTGTNGTTGAHGSTGANGTAGSNGTTTSGVAVGGAGGGPTCDPNTGVCNSAGAGGNGANGLNADQTVNGAPVSVNGLGDGDQVALMVLAAAMLLGLGLFPPLLAQMGQRRRQRRVDSYFNQDGQR